MWDSSTEAGFRDVRSHRRGDFGEMEVIGEEMRGDERERESGEIKIGFEEMDGEDDVVDGVDDVVSF